MHRIEKIILENLLKNDDYIRKVVPFLKEEYFFDSPDKKVFGAMKNFVEKYNNTPTKQALKIALDDDKTLNEETHKQCMEIIDTLNGNDVDYQWLLDETEKFCKDKAIYLGIMESIQIIDGKKNIVFLIE